MESSSSNALNGESLASDHDSGMHCDSIDPQPAAFGEGDLIRGLLDDGAIEHELAEAIAAVVAIGTLQHGDLSLPDALDLARRVRDVLVPQSVSPETVT